MSYVADVWLGNSDSFFTPDRDTAAEAFADAMRLCGCRTAVDAFRRLDLPVQNDGSRWWELPVSGFSLLRLGEDHEVVDGRRFALGVYKHPGVPV